MDDLISRRAVLMELDKYLCGVPFDEKGIDEVIKDLPSVQPEQKADWISVYYKLPHEQINKNTQDFEYVLCATVFGDVRPYKYGKQIGHEKAHFWNGPGIMDKYITHWMYMPKMPKAESEDKE